VSSSSPGAIRRSAAARSAAGHCRARGDCDRSHGSTRHNELGSASCTVAYSGPMPSTIREVFAGAGLKPEACVLWNQRVPCGDTGV
jgi:hypothetical protein